MPGRCPRPHPILVSVGCPGARHGGRGGGGAGAGWQVPAPWAASTRLLGQQQHVQVPGRKQPGRCPVPGGSRRGQNGKVGREGTGFGRPHVLLQVPCRRILLSGAYGGAGRLGRGCPTAPGPKPACGVGMGRRAASPPWVQDVGSVSAQQPGEAQGRQVRGGRWSPHTAPSLIHTLHIGPGRPPSPLWRELEGPQCRRLAC